MVLLTTLASCGSPLPSRGAEARQSGPPSLVEVTSPDPYLRTAERLRARGAQVWFEIDLVARWLDGPSTFRQAVQRVAELAQSPGTVGFKVADELGYHDGLTTKAQVLAFLRATRTALARVAPRAQVLVDAVVPELGCLRDHDAAGAACAREAGATSPGASIDTVSTYLADGLVDRLDLSARLLSASTYRARGCEAGIGTFHTVPCGPRSSAAPVPGYQGHWCIDTNRMSASRSTSACVPFPW